MYFAVIKKNKMHNLNLIMGKHQTNQDGRTFYQMIGL